MSIQFVILKRESSFKWSGLLPPLGPSSPNILVRAELQKDTLRIYAGRGSIELAANGCESWAGHTDRSYLRCTALPPDLAPLVESGLLLAISPLQPEEELAVLPDDLFLQLDDQTLAEHVRQARGGIPDEKENVHTWTQGFDRAAALYEALGRFAFDQAKALREEMKEKQEGKNDHTEII